MAALNLDVVINTANAANSVGDIRKQLKELKTAMLTVGEDTPEFEKLAAAAARLKDRVEEANEKINALNPDQFRGLQQMATGAATGVQLVTSSMALLGIESEDAQKAMMRVQAAMAFAQAINDVDKLKKGFAAFNATVKANPIIAVASALVALSVAVYNVYQAQQDANSELAKATREYEKQKEATSNQVRELDQQIELMRIQGKSMQEINDKRRESIQLQIAEAEASIEVNKQKIEQVKAQDSLWESYLRVADVVSGTNQAEALIALNKKERSEEAIKNIKEQQVAIDGLKHSLEVIDAEEKKAAEEKKEREKKAAEEKKAKSKEDAATREQQLLNEIEKRRQLEEDYADEVEQREFELWEYQKEKRKQDLEDHKNYLEAKRKKEYAAYLAKKKQDQKEAKEREELQKATLDATISLLNSLGQLSKKNAKLQKAFAIGEATVNTYKSVTVALGSAPPPANFILATANLAAGLAAIRNIIATPDEGASSPSSGGMGNVGTLDFSTQPNVGTSTQPSTLLNEQGQVINQNNDMRPMYVSVQEINDTNTNVRTAEERSRF